MEFTNVNAENPNINSTTSASSTSQTTKTSTTKSDSTSIMTKPQDELLKKLGITEAEYMALVNANPEFATMSVEKQLEYISKNKTQTTQQAEQTTQSNTTTQTSQTETPEEQSETTQSQTQTAAQEETPQNDVSDFYFNNEDYSHLPLSKKMEVYVKEYAKNSFLYSDSENPKTIDDWNNLSEEEQKKLIAQTKLALEDTFSEALSETSPELQGEVLTSMMTNLQAANYMQYTVAQLNGKEKYQGYTISQNEKEDAIYSYLSEVNEVSPNSLTDTDKNRLQYQQTLVDAVSSAAGRDNMCLADAEQYMKDNNLTQTEVLHEYLTKKSQTGKLTEKEEKLLNSLDTKLNDPAMKLALLEAKVQGLENLETELEEAKKNGDTARAEQLEKIINSKDSQEIRKWAEDNKIEKKEPPKKYTKFMESSFGKLYDQTSDPQERAAILMAYIKETHPNSSKKQSKLAIDLYEGLCSEGIDAAETKVSFLSACLSFDPEIGTKLMDKATPYTTTAGTNEAIRDGRNLAPAVMQKVGEIQYKFSQSQIGTQKLNERAEKYLLSKKPVNIGVGLISSTQGALENSNISDETKDAYIGGLGEANKETEIANKNIDITTTYKDADLQLKSNKTINKFATEESKAYGAVHTDLMLSENQTKLASMYTKDSKLATEAFVEDGTWARFDKENQTEGMELAYNRTDELFEGEEKIELLNKNADHIADADKENQLDMHNFYMDSKYSEVVEHAAGNIYKYDESVQGDALDSTRNTGNQDAIDAAMSNFDKYPDYVQENPKYQAMQQETEVRQAQEVAQQVAEFHDQYEKLTGMQSNIEQEITDDEQKLSYIKNFLNASPQEQFKMLSKIPMSWQGTVFSRIATYCPQMLSGLVKQGYGQYILNTPGLDSDVVYKVVDIMLTCQTSDKKAAAKYVKSHKAMFQDSTIERCEEISNKNNNKKKNYTSMPLLSTVKGALAPKKSSVYPNQEELDIYNA